MTAGLSPLLNSVEVLSASTTSTGPITLGALASVNSLTMATAGGVTGQPYVFRADDAAHGGDFMIFRGTYTSSGPSISIDTMIVSSINGVVVSGSAAPIMPVTTATIIRLVWVADDMITRQQSMSRNWLIG